MLVTIVTPSFNSEKYIEETILSVANQTYTNIEHIIVDGCSTDGTLKIVDKYPHINLIIDKDDSMYQAITKGLKVAKGEICAYLNSDDLYYRDTVRYVVDYFNDNEQVGLIYSDIAFIDYEGSCINMYKYPKFNWNTFVAYRSSYIPQPTTFWRKKIHVEAGYFDESFKMAGDKEFFINVGKNYNINKVDKVLAMQRLHAGSLTYRANKSRENVLLVIKENENKILNDRYKTGRSIWYWNLLNLKIWLQIKTMNWRIYLKRLWNFLRPVG